MRIPAATVHGLAGHRLAARARAAVRSPAGRIAAWSATLALAQTALLAGATGAPDGIAARAALGATFAVIAAIVVATVWVLRMAIPIAPRAFGVVVPVVFYGAAALAAPGHEGLLAATLLAPAAAWSPWLPRGRVIVRAA